MSSPPRSAFARLRALLHGVPPAAGLDAVELHLGESRLGPPPAIDFTPLASAEGWTRYPRLGGSAELRAAYGQWLGRRFGVRHSLSDGTLALEPTPGTKQAVAVTLSLAVADARRARTGVPAVVMPNPFYPTYRGGAEAAGARPVFYTSYDAGDAGPVEAAVRAAGGRAAAVIVCNPGNPRGEIMPADTLRAVARIAARAGALLVVDECYTDLSLGRAAPGYLSLVEEDGGAAGPFVVLHSLSKRSGTPGLRSGFLAGDPRTVGAYAGHNRLCGVSCALPVDAVSTALWSDDTHVARARAALAKNWELADETLGDLPRYRRAEAGFFLWLPVGDDEETTRRLWSSHALMVMPGRYLAAEGPEGVNPGLGHVRIALVHDAVLMRTALTRLRKALLSFGATCEWGEPA
ncbi:aminotransferase class I/II-fold pyridoxal phosphate-dependent enzyme [Streptomyces sp. NPDC052020]|uniref:aminotransferase class I/II-fold pyridoxal phosphate-dependent enzyme n=1 Tax=Streptomyces sp. NPDC052020 TaxID=3155677 RepID=UPI003428A5C9